MIDKKTIQDTYDSILISDYNIQTFLQRYLDDISYSPNIENFDAFYESSKAKKILKSKDFHDWIMYEIPYILEERQKKIYSLFENGKIPIWRAMTVNNNWIDNLSKSNYIKLGIYWSWFEKGAVAYNAKPKLKNLVVIKTRVEKNKIDWNNTLVVNVLPEVEEEMEITLKPNVDLKIEELSINEKKVSINNKILNKTFKS